MTDILIITLINFYLNLQKVTKCLMENKNYLNQSFVILSDCLKNFKHIYEEKKMKLLEKLFEEEATRTKVLQNNPNITSFITNFSKLKRETNNKIENAFKLSFETEGEKSEEKKEVLKPIKNFQILRTIMKSIQHV